jgi:hypothetical protein
MFYSHCTLDPTLIRTLNAKVIYNKDGEIVEKRRLQLGLCALASDGALDEAVGVRLGGEDGRILTEVLDVLVPREIYGALVGIRRVGREDSPISK